MNATEAEQYIGQTVAGREISGVCRCGSAALGFQVYLMCGDDRVVNVTNKTTEDLRHLPSTSGTDKRARHKTG